MIRIAFNSLNLLSLHGRNSQKKGWHHNGKSLSYNLLVLVERGQCNFQINGEEFTLKTGDVIIIPKNTYYVPNTTGECDFAYFWFNGEVDTNDDDEFFLLLPQTHEINATTIKFLNEVLSENNKMEKNVAFYNALLSIHRKLLHKNDNIASSIRKYLLDNINENISLDDLAKHFSYTKQHVIRLFKSCYSISPVQFINREKLKKSCEFLMQRQDLSISQIANRCGFSDAGYFSRLFKREYKISPKKFCNRNIDGV